MGERGIVFSERGEGGGGNDGCGVVMRSLLSKQRTVIVINVTRIL